ncbi:MAG: Do family serine endopeptidase [Alphaproteobacteria bacterium]|nr:Do family serine endopeptidase [Alphaproteobacteria bacterium]MBT5390354.1 Do family serine endopeptidase [Alphaproteobacteria bacterium]
MGLKLYRFLGVVFCFAMLVFDVCAADRPQSFAKTAERALPTVVNISTKHMSRAAMADMKNLPQFGHLGDLLKEFLEFHHSRPREISSLGSGYIVDPKGYVVTNRHVIAKADEITVILNDGSEHDAKIIGVDSRTDVAVLKIEPEKPLPSIEWGNSTEARVGDWILVIGNPFGLGGTVTAGIISSRARDISSQAGDIALTKYVDNMIQTDAAINLGNSGGPMFDMNGNVIGMNVAIFSPSGGNVGIGFAIPSSIVKRVVEQIKTTGRAQYAWMGVVVQDVTEEIADSLGLDKERGALVTNVAPNGPAQKAQLQPGDVILSFNNHQVPNYENFPRMVGETRIGTVAPVKIWRKGKEINLKLTLEEYPNKEGVAEMVMAKKKAASQEPEAGEFLGISVGPITEEIRKKLNISDDVNGAIVFKIDSGSVASKKGIQVGDLVVEVNQHPISDHRQVLQKISNAMAKGNKTVLLKILRGQKSVYIGLPLDNDR